MTFFFAVKEGKTSTTPLFYHHKLEREREIDAVPFKNKK